MEVFTEKGIVFTIDSDDEPKLHGYTWKARQYTNNLVYIEAMKKGRLVYLHRLIMNAPQGSQVDHIDGNGLNNHKSNLRLCTNSLNQANSKKRVDNSTGYKGVYFQKTDKKWRSHIKVNGKKYHLGVYITPEEASMAYKKAAIEFFGEFSRIN